jgi:hypothetical protein
MSTELICSALGVRPDQWPPDHYALLGLPAGDVDPVEIEQHVLDRMERLRRYQLVAPEAVTDAMNRLAQALVCLSDPVAKAAYDAARGHVPIREPARVAVEEDESSEPYSLAAAEPIPVAPIVRQLAPPRRRTDDPRRSLYRRLGAARRLLAAWRAVGDFIADPSRRSLRPAETIEFVGALLELRARLADDAVPAVVLPGQPGSLVAALARQPLPLSTYRQFLPEQRVTLRADWQAGEQRVAEAYRSMGHAVRRHQHTASRRAVRKLARSLVSDRLDLVLFVMGLAALTLALLSSR